MKVVTKGDCADSGRVLEGLEAAGPNDLGSARRLLEEWPEDVFITGPGIDALPLSEAAKAVVIFKQMRRMSPDSFVGNSFASSVADVFQKAAAHNCQGLSGGWWRGLNDEKAHLRIEGELSIQHGMPEQETWRNHDLFVHNWAPLGTVDGYLRPKGSSPAIYFKVSARNADTAVLQLKWNVGSPSEGSREYELNVVPTEALEILKHGLTPFLPENAGDQELQEMRTEAEENKKGSVRPAIEAIQGVLDHRAEVLAKAKELLQGAGAENVGQRTKERLSNLAEQVVPSEQDAS
ncbi:hypothetical protein ACFL6C_12515 [Myxococcota bacterium]